MKDAKRLAQMTFGAILFLSGAAVADSCKTVTGTISPLQPVACANPLGCFQGTFSGDLNGSFQSVLTSLTVVDPAQGMLSFTARTVMQTQVPDGAIHTSDVGTGSGCFMLNNQFVCPYSNEVLTITSGTRAYTQKYGSITLSGGYMAGASGVYQGQICTGNTK